MATHSSTLAWKIPWMEEPGGLQSMGSLSRTRLPETGRGEAPGPGNGPEMETREQLE